MKRCIGLLLVFCMVIAMLPFSSLAAEEVASGTCGDNLTWTLDAGGTLTISGTGAMDDYTHYDTSPWHDYQDSITSVIINEGVTSIGNYAFFLHDKLISVEIPNSITSIGYYAFCNCTSLIALDIPDNVTDITEGLFSGCSKLTSVTIGSGVTTIYSSVFNECKSLVQITVDENNLNYSSDDWGVLFNKEKTELIQAPCAISGAYPIPKSVATIGNEAFINCSNLSSVVIPSNVADIGEAAFFFCQSLANVNIPNGITTIAPLTFFDCDSLLNVQIPSSVTTISDFAFGECDNLITVEIPDSVTTIGKNAFTNCISLTDVKIGNSTTLIGSYAFGDCNNLSKIQFLCDVPSIANDTFYNVTATAYYPANNPTWTEDVMQDYGGDITWVPCGAEHIHEFDANHKCECGAIGGTCGENLTWILDEEGTLTISGTGAMEEFNTEAPWYSYRKEITAVVIESGITTIGKNAFAGCYATSITIPEGIITIGYAAFSGCNITSITIPQGVTSIGGDAFFDCWNLRAITLPQSVTSIGEFAFGNCFPSSVFYRGTENRRNSIAVGDFNENLTSADWHYEVTNATYEGQPAYLCGKCDYYYAFDGSKLGKGNGNVHAHTYTSTVTSPNCVGMGYTTHTCECGHSYIDDEVPALGHNYVNNICSRCAYDRFAYGGTCGESLTWTLFKDGTLTISGSGAMEDYNSDTPWDPYRWDITTVVIEDGVTTIGRNAFEGCNMVSIIIPNSVTSIGQFAFWNCQKLTSITIPVSVTFIHEDQFGGCWSLSKIWVDKDNPNFSSDEYGFLFNKNKTTLIRAPLTVEQYTIPNTVTGIGIWAFDHCKNLTEIIISENVTSIGDYAFIGCDALKRVTIPDGVTNIGYEAFNCCWELESVTIPASVTSIGIEAFSRCWVLNGIWVSEDNPNYSSDKYGVMFNKDKTTLIQAPGAIEQYDIPESVTVIGEAAFEDCFNLTNIVIPDSVVVINRSAFYSCRNLGRIAIPNSVTSIGQYAFFDCEDLTSIVVPASVKNIDYLALGDCSSLVSITFEGNAPKFNSRIFTDVTVTAFYPANNVTWTEEIRQNYGGQITWVAYDPCKDGHDMVDDKGYAATCTETGLTDGKHCTRCDTETVEQEEIPALGHNMVDDKGYAATCTEPGLSDGKHCTRCDAETVEQEVIPALGHNMVDDKGYAATCTEPGLTEGKHCTRCDAETVEQEEIPALGHNMVDDKGYAATCTEPGLTAGTHCNRCGKTLTAQTEIPALGHNEVTDKGKAATCTEPGLTDGTLCDRCNKTLTAQTEIPAKGHSWGEGVVTKEPTEEETGIRLFTCTVCQETKTESIPELTHVHKHEATVTEPTCTEAGYTTYTCKCGDSYTEKGEAALGHKETNDTGYAATCTESGLTDGKHCTRCDAETVKQEEIPALGHDMVEDKGYAATCTETGLTDGKHCTRCDAETVKQEVLPALGCSFTEYYSNNDATCIADGTKTASCDRGCGETDTVADEDSLNPDAHAFGEWVTEDNEKHRTCELCGCTESHISTDSGDVEIEAPEQPGHDFDVDPVEPTDEQYVLVEEAINGDGEAESEVLKVFDITLKDEDGVHVQPNGTVKVKLPLDWEKEGNYKVYRVNDDGTLTDMNAYRQGSHIVFETDHFSLYVIVEEPEHKHELTLVPAVEATCNAAGGKAYYTCSGCDSWFKDAEGNVEITDKQTVVIPSKGHDYENGVCAICGNCAINRIYGNDRIGTALSVAAALKDTLGIEKFDTIILAAGGSGQDQTKFADALSGSYLASAKNAPILLYTKGDLAQANLEFIAENLSEDGTIYLLGGNVSIPAEVEAALVEAGYTVKRLAGDDRYLTNLAILKEVGVEGVDEVLIAGGQGFADSLSASATGLPIMLVKGSKTTLTEAQIEFLKSVEGKKITILGGNAAVSAELEAAIEEVVGKDVERVFGETREETSVMIAKKYFPEAKMALIAYSRMYPDGLAGGVLSNVLGAPLLLTKAGSESIANEYIEEIGIEAGYVLGGSAVMTDETAKAVFGLAEDTVILNK